MSLNPNKNKKDELFINEHILNRISFDDIYKEKTIQNKARRAFYAVWTNWIFINPKTENLQALNPEDYGMIKKLSYGTKNRLQSYLAFHLERDHYEMNFDDFSDNESYSTIQMCEEVFNDTYLLVNWWRSNIQTRDLTETLQTGEEWFQKSKEKFQHQKLVNKIGYCFIDLLKKRFLVVKEEDIFWTTEQEMATRFNLKENTEKSLILDQETESNKEEIITNVMKIVNNKNLKVFLQQRNQKSNEVFFIEGAN